MKLFRLILLTVAALGLQSCYVTAQTPAAGSVGFTVKNAGAGSSIQWAAPGTPPSVFGVAEGGAISNFPLDPATFAIEDGVLTVTGGGSGGGTWGSITGTLSAQTDLQNALNAKLAVTTAASTYVALGGSYADPTWITSLAKSKVGLGSVENTALSTWTGSSSITTLGTVATGVWNGTPVPITHGGTGAQDGSEALDNLGLPTWEGSTAIDTVGTITAGAWNGSAVAVAYGGTGATNASDARTNLGLVIGTHVLAPTGNGSGLTSLNASALSSGTVATARLGTGTANSSSFLRGDGTWAAPSGGGDVVGPSSATNGAIAVYDGTTGKLIKNSAVTITTSPGNYLNADGYSASDGFNSSFFGAAGFDWYLEGGSTVSVRPSPSSGSWTLVLPLDDGSNGQALATDGDGNGSWQSFLSPSDIGSNVQAYNANTTTLGNTTTGTGSIVRASSPTLTTPVIGVATGTSLSLSGSMSASNFSGSSSGTNTGDQTITLTGDVTGSGTGSFSTTLANSGVVAGTYSSANITVDAKGRITAATNGSGGGGGLSYFTEALSSSSPNATVNVSSLTASGGSTKQHAAVVAKGGGAFVVQVPTGTNVGGNQPGDGAFSGQSVRAAAGQTASGYATFVFGASNTASGLYSGAVNLNNTSSGTGSFACGGYNDSTGAYSFASGSSTVSSANYGTTLGFYSRSDRHAMIATAGGRFVSAGDAQVILPGAMFRKTTDDTPTELLLDGSSLRWTIPAGKVCSFAIMVQGIKSDGSAVAFYERRIAIKNVSGTTSAVFAAVTIGTDVSSGTGLTVDANDTNDALRVQVTGIAAETWRWTASVTAIETAYGN